MRYTAALTIDAMRSYGLHDLASEDRVRRLRKLDSIDPDDVEAFQRVGAAAAREVDLAHAEGFLS